MFCSNCGTQNVAGETFCKNCGCKLNNVTNNQTQINDAQQPMQNQNMGMNNNFQQPMQQQSTINNFQNNTSNGGLDPNYVEKAVNPNMKKWAILSIIVPIAGMIFYWFIGLSFYIAIFIAAAGFGFAQKGEMSNKKLAVIGKVLNGMLGAMAVIMLILNIIAAVAS